MNEQPDQAEVKLALEHAALWCNDDNRRDYECLTEQDAIALAEQVRWQEGELKEKQGTIEGREGDLLEIAELLGFDELGESPTVLHIYVENLQCEIKCMNRAIDASGQAVLPCFTCGEPLVSPPCPPIRCKKCAEEMAEPQNTGSDTNNLVTSLRHLAEVARILWREIHEHEDSPPSVALGDKAADRIEQLLQFVADVKVMRVAQRLSDAVPERWPGEVKVDESLEALDEAQPATEQAK